MAQVNDPPLLVVGLGASAGDIQALSTFFEYVPLDAPIAYVVIPHLSPQLERTLAQVLQTATSLPVREVTQETVIEARHVYVAPRGTLSVGDGRLILTPHAGPEEQETAIDIFFRTLADRYGHRAAGVILSGTGASGSSGLRRVKEHGGLTVAELPSDADDRNMSERAVATSLVDYILPAADMPRCIADYAERLNRENPDETNALTKDRLLTAALPRTPERRTADDIPAGELHLRLLEQFAPPSIIITDDHTIVHMSDRAGRFVQMPGEEPSRDLLKVVHPDLRSTLRRSLRVATQSRQPVEMNAVRMDTDGATMLVDVTVKPVLRDGTPPQGYFVVMFEQADAPPAPRTTFDEPRLTNHDSQNLILSANIGAIFLDESMRVKLATPRAQDAFNLLPTDIGRRLTDVTSTLVYQNLEDDVRKVLHDHETIDREVPTHDGGWFLLRLAPSRTLDRRTEGVVLTFQDVTTRHDEDEQYVANEERLRGGLEDRVRERTAQLEAEVRRHADAQVHIRALLGRVVTAQEDERARVARELHDQLGQQLTALRLTIERLRAQPASAGLEADIDRALGIARDLDRAVDFLAWELRPAILDHLGLAVALSHFVDQWSEHYGVTAKFQSIGTVNGLLPPQADIAFYRIAQEALNNVGKHAYATRVDVILEVRDTSVVMVLEDDGVGFDVPGKHAGEKGFGISSMRERATLIGATLDIESSPGQGTTVYVRCPAGVLARERA